MSADSAGVGIERKSAISGPGAPYSRDASVRGSVPGDPFQAGNGAPANGEAASARVATTRAGHGLIVELGGDWELGGVTPRLDDLLSDVPGDQAVKSIGFDAAQLGRWDSSLLSFLLQSMSYCEARELEFRAETLPEDIAALLQLARVVPEHETPAKVERRSFAGRLGRRGQTSYQALLGSAALLGEITQGFIRLLSFRTRMRWREFGVVMQSNSSGALPIVTLISFLVGLIIAFLGAVVLRRFGAGYYVSYLVGYGMLREMAALMTGIIMAGRTGAAFAAELGSMKITEEIDAYKTLGVSPVEHLVLPRVLGLFVMMPVLTIYSMFVGIVGGMLVSITLLDLSATQFLGGLLAPVTLSDGLLGVFKGMVFGLIIGIAGCMRGMQTGSDAGAVGRAATSAVVTGITLIIAANAIIDWLSALIGV